MKLCEAGKGVLFKLSNRNRHLLCGYFDGLLKIVCDRTHKMDGQAGTGVERDDVAL